MRAGHLWVYSNEVDTRATPLAGFAPGDLAQVRSAGGAPLGFAYVNPNSLICARLLAREPQPLPALIAARLGAALRLRQRLYPRPFYRLVNGEGDWLPGLIVDRYDDALVLQFNTAGMERMRELVLDALRALLPETGVLVLRNDAPVRELEGLPLVTEVLAGEARDRLRIEEHGAQFEVPLLGGQKTGWYFDQRDNRTRALDFAGGARVLDAYAYAGAWTVRCALAGARAVTALDSSAGALALARENAALNPGAAPIDYVQADASDALRDLGAAGERFDLLVLDPPPLIRRRRDQRAGESHYLRINRLALALLRGDGILVTCSCSHHMSGDALRRIVVQAARREGRRLQLLASGGQGPDHPQHPAIAETAYLKALFFRVLD